MNLRELMTCRWWCGTTNEADIPEGEHSHHRGDRFFDSGLCADAGHSLNPGRRGARARGCPDCGAPLSPGTIHACPGTVSMPFAIRLTSIADPRSPREIVRDLPLLAQRLGLMVEVDINDVRMFVSPGDTPDDADARWRREFERVAPQPERSRVAEIVEEYARAHNSAPQSRAVREVTEVCERVAETAVKMLRDAGGAIDNLWADRFERELLGRRS